MGADTAQVPVDSYFLAAQLGIMADDCLVVTGNATDAFSVFTCWRNREQGCISSFEYGTMGWDIPAAIGAHIATGKRVICYTGDGSIQLNAQELGTIAANDFDIKVFVLVNGGYRSIRNTAKRYSLTLKPEIPPCDFEALAKAYGLRYVHMGSPDDMEDVIADILSDSHPVLCTVNGDPEQRRYDRE